MTLNTCEGFKNKEPTLKRGIQEKWFEEVMKKQEILQLNLKRSDYK